MGSITNCSPSGQVQQSPSQQPAPQPPSKHARYVKRCIVDGIVCDVWAAGKRGLSAVPIENETLTNGGGGADERMVRVPDGANGAARGGRSDRRWSRNAGAERRSAALAATARLRRAVLWLLAVMGILGALLGCGR